MRQWVTENNRPSNLFARKNKHSIGAGETSYRSEQEMLLASGAFWEKKKKKKNKYPVAHTTPLWCLRDATGEFRNFLASRISDRTENPFWHTIPPKVQIHILYDLVVVVVVVVVFGPYRYIVLLLRVLAAGNLGECPLAAFRL